VTPAAYIDKCLEYALTPGYVLLSFGDMLKVPGTMPSAGTDGVFDCDEASDRAGAFGYEGAADGMGTANCDGAFDREGTSDSEGVSDRAGAFGYESAADGMGTSDRKTSVYGRSLSSVQGDGGQVQMIYSPFEALDMATAEPETTFVIAAVGFETTAPAYGLLMDEITERGIRNIKLLTAIRMAIPAIGWICRNEPGVDGFLAPGHVSVITGSRAYGPLAERYLRPFVIAGFEAEHIVRGIASLVRYSSPEDSGSGTSGGVVANLYGEAVSGPGNLKAQAVISKYFEPGTAMWRGLGELPDSGLFLKPEFAAYDAGSRGLTRDAKLPEGCRCGDVITGRINPDECPMFGKGCAPGHPYGPCMVSAEGACGIWFRNI
jgi:hydrogenase expression/formation protein HypD